MTYSHSLSRHFRIPFFAACLVIFAGFSCASFAADTEAPTIPGNLTATASSPTQVNLVWTASTDLGGGVVAGYDVYRDGAKLKANITSTSYSDPTAQPNTQYSYRVDAFDNAKPRNKSPKSNTATVTTSSPLSSGNTGSAPTVPPNFTGKAVSHKKIVLWWTSSRDTGGGEVAGYKVFRNSSQIATVTEPHFSDLNLKANTTYSYRIAAFDDASPANNSSQTSSLSLKTLAPPAICSGVTIAPTSNAVNIVQSHAAGTTFCFQAGTHRLSAPIDARANDRYIGAPGAILDGRNTITHAFSGRSGNPNQQNVTIRGLIIQNFQNAYDDFATRNTIKAGDYWTIENNEIRNNYETGIHLGQGIRLRNNHIHHNGRYGITVGPGLNQNMLIDGNEISYNNTRNLPWATAGTAKVIGSSTGVTGLTWKNNWIHHNNGHGLHHDYNVGPNIEIAFNRVEGNIGNGIQHEASWGADIHHNVTINNARKYIGKSCFHGSQIYLLMSSDVTIRNNHVESTEDSNGICMRDAIGDLAPPASTTIHNVKVVDNTIKLIGSAQTGVVGADSEVDNLSKNFFDRNTYFVPEPETGVNWAWYIIHYEWQNTGQGPNSTFRAW
ncbi:MAG: right-handed parallel beta-helix repeat-containing protein [Nitrospirales bacterium]|nr:right-handed parallel beta-helix repeat-containing protein [Nitrospirales bacterium]